MIFIDNSDNFKSTSIEFERLCIAVRILIPAIISMVQLTMVPHLSKCKVKLLIQNVSITCFNIFTSTPELSGLHGVGLFVKYLHRSRPTILTCDFSVPSSGNRKPKMSGMHLRSHIGMQHHIRMHRWRVWTVQGHLAVLGWRRQAHAQQSGPRGSHCFRQLCQRPLLCRIDCPRIHDQIPTGSAIWYHSLAFMVAFWDQVNTYKRHGEGMKICSSDVWVWSHWP